MGWGDHLMAAGEARKLHEALGRDIVIVDRHNAPTWSELWEGIPYILRERRQNVVAIRNSSGCRPYIALKTPQRWRWRKFQPTPAEYHLRPEELALVKRGADMVMVEPNTKAIGHTNKAWIWSRWQELIDALPGVDFVQCLAPDSRPLDGVTHVRTNSFREAMAVLSGCRSIVTTEGGLMHGAAALGVPGVILWSEFISPEITGYKMHRNLRHAGEPCGNRIDCKGCRESMHAITVREVVEALKETLNEARR